MHPLGSTAKENVDIRIIAATNRNLIDMVDSGEFRRDLFYRLNVVPLHIPPLRERNRDIPELVMHFLQLAAQRNTSDPVKFSHKALEALEKHGISTTLVCTIKKGVNDEEMAVKMS